MRDKLGVNVTREILQAEERIRPYIRETYLDFSPWFSEEGAAEVYFKLENLQHTGSFKVRGALNKVLSLSAEARQRGVVTASTGNHGAAVAFALQTVGAHGLVFVPENAAETKLANIRQFGAEIRLEGDDGVVAETAARAYAEENDLAYISPYNDLQVVGGQGTVGLEMTRQIDRLDAVFVALGGGGLISGVAAHLKSQWPDVKIIGCSPRNSKVMIDSLKAGEILDLPSLPTLSDGTAGGVEAGSITFEMCRQWVDETISVTEKEIGAALKLFMQKQHMLVEGAAAAAVAAYFQQKERYAGQKVAVIICGANISLEILKGIL